MGRALARHLCCVFIISACVWQALPVVAVLSGMMAVLFAWMIVVRDTAAADILKA